MSVDKLQDAEEHVAQLREEADAGARAARVADLQQPPVAETSARAHRVVTAALRQVRSMRNMRTGVLPEIHELAVSIKETGLLHPPLVRETGDEDVPYELLAGQRRLAAMRLLDEAEGERESWRFTVVEGVSGAEALAMQFAENFHQHKPEPVQFARAARRIMAEDASLTAADVSRMVGAPPAWTRRALRLLELPEPIVERVERGDLSFTSADLVRRGIARGDVSEDEAEELVEQHAAGALSGAALRQGVGSVAPPRDPDERNDDPERHDWEPASSGGGVTPIRPSAAQSAVGGGRIAPEDLDAYLLGVVLWNSSTDHRRKVLRIGSEADAHEYAFSLLPQERLDVLRSLAAEMLAADPQPPRALRPAA